MPDTPTAVRDTMGPTPRPPTPTLGGPAGEATETEYDHFAEAGHEPACVATALSETLEDGP